MAQRTQDNAVTSSSDAFGKAVGNEKTGLYAIDDIRGFNPIEAGNARIEGLYFDQQERLSPRLTDGSTIRVGITAQSYPFPAPTGIVDYRLKTARARPSASLELERGAYGGLAASLETAVPLDGDRLGMTAGLAARRLISPQGGVTNFRAFAASLAWHPTANAVVTTFWSGIQVRGEDATPTIFPVDNLLPPQIERGRFIAQPWARRFAGSRTYGAIAKLPLLGARIEAGLFRSHRFTETSFADLFTGARASGQIASHVIIADGDNDDDSISGELRLVRDWVHGDWRHHLYATARGRAKDRDFGGQVAIPLGADSLLDPRVIARPSFTLGANDHDRVRQTTFGLGYAAEWARRASISASVATSQYRKTVDFADPNLANARSQADPVLYSIGGSVFLRPSLALYGGYVRGLEESIIAPEIATNRGEAPPAILTRQVDLGLRYAVTPNLSLVAGVFSVRKPYFGLDTARRFGQLGIVDNRGVEISLAGRLRPGVSMVAGMVLLDSTISGDAVALGQIGARPVGSVRRRTVMNIDWKPQHQTRWSFDLAIESVSSRIGNTRNLLIVPARTTLAIGTRYRIKLGDVSSLIRIQATNLTDEYGWLVSNSGGFTYSPGRTVTAQLIFDL
jgi:iron complex outermembrane recepter protein